MLTSNETQIVNGQRMPVDAIVRKSCEPVR